MIALVVSACLIGDPAVCRTFRTPVPDETDAIACTISAQAFLPQWNEEHPGWRIGKWACVASNVADL
jgi:hypothetical protein